MSTRGQVCRCGRVISSGLLAVFALLSGCSSAPDRDVIKMSAEAVPNFKRASNEFRDGLTYDQANDALEEDYFAVLSDCSKALSRFEVEGERRSRLAQKLAFGGLLAGSVAVPALTAASAVGNAAWVAGLGGFAGATNTAQHWIQQNGLGYIESLRSREQIRSDFKVAIEEYFASGDIGKRRASLMRAKAACVLYAVSIPNVQIESTEEPGSNGGGEQQPPGDKPPAAGGGQAAEEVAPVEPPTDAEKPPAAGGGQAAEEVAPAEPPTDAEKPPAAEKAPVKDTAKQ